MKRLRYRIPFIGKVFLRLDAAINLITDEWGCDSRADALEMIDDEAKDMLKPKPFRQPVGPLPAPYAVNVDFHRDYVEVPRPPSGPGLSGDELVPGFSMPTKP